MDLFGFENRVSFGHFCFSLSVSILISQLNYKMREHIFMSVQWECGLTNKISTLLPLFH